MNSELRSVKSVYLFYFSRFKLPSSWAYPAKIPYNQDRSRNRDLFESDMRQSDDENELECKQRILQKKRKNRQFTCVIVGVCHTHRFAPWNVCLLIWLTINCELLRFECFSAKGCSVPGIVCVCAAWRINQLQKPQICICKFKLSTFLWVVWAGCAACD